MTIASWLQKISDSFRSLEFESPNFEARLLVQEALGLTPAELILFADKNISSDQEQKLKTWQQERSLGVPLAYICGRKGFYKSEFIVRPGVLIPRPESEFVVTTALRRGRTVRRMADLGCGSGCIGLSTILDIPQALLYAVDSSDIACAVTKTNASALGLSARVHVIQSLVENWSPPESLDLIVGNPPYIAEGDTRVQAHVHKYEPHSALYSGSGGLDALRSWIECSARYLGSGGILVLEFGAGQTAALREIMSAFKFKDVEITKDLAGIDRVISGTK